MIELTSESDLTSYIRANGKTVALFYASWCPFCRNFLPIFEKYAQKTGSRTFILVKINDDDNPLWEKYSFEAVPSVILFEYEKVSRRLESELGGGLTEGQYRQWLQIT